MPKVAFWMNYLKYDLCTYFLSVGYIFGGIPMFENFSREGIIFDNYETQLLFDVNPAPFFDDQPASA